MTASLSSSALPPNRTWTIRTVKMIILSTLLPSRIHIITRVRKHARKQNKKISVFTHHTLNVTCSNFQPLVYSKQNKQTRELFFVLTLLHFTTVSHVKSENNFCIIIISQTLTRRTPARTNELPTNTCCSTLENLDLLWWWEENNFILVCLFHFKSPASVQSVW